MSLLQLSGIVADLIATEDASPWLGSSDAPAARADAFLAKLFHCLRPYGGTAWLPVLHTSRAERHYTALYSNTARAPECTRFENSPNSGSRCRRWPVCIFCPGASGTWPAGAHAVTWDGTTETGRRAASGTYLYLIDAGGRIQYVSYGALEWDDAAVVTVIETLMPDQGAGTTAAAQRVPH